MSPTPPKRAAGLFSGGKDSSYALYLAGRRGYRITRLLNLRPAYCDSMLYHLVGGAVTGLQARAMDLPLEVVDVPSPQREVELLEAALARLDVDALVGGAVASNYQRQVFTEACRRLGLELACPLWGRNDPDALREIVGAGFDVMMAAVGADGLGKEWLGRRLDAAAVEELLRASAKYRFSPMGEGGEYETLVLASPMMHGRIDVEYRVRWGRDRGVVEVTAARLVNREKCY